MTQHNEPSKTHRELLKRLRWAGLAEGATLVVLIFLAVPLKHLGGDARLVSIMGPVHGLAFLAYMWFLLQTVGAGLWVWRDAVRLALASLLPFGTWIGDRLVRQRLHAVPGSDE